MAEEIISVYKQRLDKVIAYSKEKSPKGKYHNYEHEADVACSARRLAYFDGLDSHQIYLLETAAYLHDVINVPFASDNEEKSANVAQGFLPSIGYSQDEVNKVKSMILATKFPTSPRNHLEKVICDADLDNLGREDFFERSELLRQEWGVADRLKWGQWSLDMLMKHKYYTRSARALREYGLAHNISKSMEMIISLSDDSSNHT